MEINMDSVLSAADNFNKVQTSLQIFEYKNKLNEYLTNGLNRDRKKYITDFFYSNLPEQMKPLIIGDTYLIKEYYRTNLFPYLYGKLWSYKTELNKILDITPNRFFELRNDIITNTNELFAIIERLTKYTNTKFITLEEFLKDIYLSFLLIDKYSDLNDREVTKGTYLSFIFRLKDMCTDMLHIIIEEEKDEN